METIPVVFWMGIITILTVFLCLIFFYLAMLLKETKKTVTEIGEVVKESKGLVKQSKEILAEAQEVTNMAKGVVSTIETTTLEINNQIIQPVRSIGSLLSTITHFLEGLKGK